MHDDLEHLVERSLGERAQQLGSGDGSIDDVMARAERRQQRRRATAVVGSLAVVAVGLVGLSVVRGADEPLGRSAGLDAGQASTVPLRVIDGSLDAWRCEGPIEVQAASDDPGWYFEGCAPVTIVGGVPLELDPTIVPAMVPTTIGMEVPVTWVECPPAGPADTDAAVATTTPACSTVPATTISYCEETDASGTRVTIPCDMPAATAPPTTAPISSENVVEYVIEPGDFPGLVAEAYGIPIDELADANRNNPAWDTFHVGATIRIPIDP
ncbi:MAG: hypothetical protein CL424_03360 [Acidimicrobiaceae bacterium]|nr:hypothetical protein [Acidimicrobiaceae bacterium]